VEILHDSKLLLGLSKVNVSAVFIDRTETSAVVFREQNSAVVLMFDRTDFC
jgi:hypothetical protein